MADGYISQIKTPDNKVYLLKDSEKTDEKVQQTSNTENKEFPIILKNTNNTTNETAGVKYASGVTINPSDETVTALEFIGNLRSNKIVPIESKTFTGFYATANNDNRKIAFFGTITRTDVNIPWRIRLKIQATIPNYPSYAYTDWDIDYWGFGAATKAQYIKVNHGTNYALYSLQIYYPKDTTDNNILIGVYVYANNNYNNSAYARTLKIDYLGSENCTFSFNQSLVYRESITTANYTAVGVTLNSTGYQETGDTNSNTYDRTYMNNNKKARVAIVAGSICVGNSDGYAGIDNGVEFDITYPILYQPTAITVNGVRSDFYLYYPSITSTVNTTGLTHVANGILYMTGTLSGTTFTCNSKTLTYTVPTVEDDIIYIPVAINTNATTQSLYFLGGTAHLFWYKDGAFREYINEAAYALSAPLSGISNADDLKAIEALSGTTGLLKKTAENTWTLDTSNYVTSSGITSITLKAGAGITLDTDNTAITSTGTRTISINGINTTSGSETTCLTAKGTWKTFGTSNLTIGTTSSTAMAGNTTVTNVAISADTTTNKDYAVVFGTTPSDGTTPTAAKTEGLQKNIGKFYFNPSSGSLNATSFCVDEHVNFKWNSTDSALEFVFA